MSEAIPLLVSNLHYSLCLCLLCGLLCQGGADREGTKKDRGSTELWIEAEFWAKSRSVSLNSIFQYLYGDLRCATMLKHRWHCKGVLTMGVWSFLWVCLQFYVTYFTESVMEPIREEELFNSNLSHKNKAYTYISMFLMCSKVFVLLTCTCTWKKYEYEKWQTPQTQLFVSSSTGDSSQSLSLSAPVTQHHCQSVTCIPLCSMPQEQKCQLCSNCKNLYYYGCKLIERVCILYDGTFG